ncbi:Rv3235 family protein [Nakamurella sp.]|uniref:Rv3235 family protein n=1 Tax=Nakamurella sp. TaxID=1869182 RepID=UPI0037850404
MTAAVAGSAGRRTNRPYLAPVPDSEPPFDQVGGPHGSAATIHERRPAAGFSPGGNAPIQLAASVTAPIPAPTSVACAAVPSWSADPDIGIRRTGTAQLPAAPRAAQVFTTALVEVLAGRRPVGQLRVHTAPAVFAGLVNRAPHGLSAPAHVMSVRICQPTDGVAEVSATVRSGARVRAIAFRMEGVDGRWRVTALDIG